jgi:hypothetical protein
MAIFLLVFGSIAFACGAVNYANGTTVIALGFFFVAVVAWSGAGIINAIQNK